MIIVIIVNVIGMYYDSDNHILSQRNLTLMIWNLKHKHRIVEINHIIQTQHIDIIKYCFFV